MIEFKRIALVYFVIYSTGIMIFDSSIYSISKSIDWLSNVKCFIIIFKNDYKKYILLENLENILRKLFNSLSISFGKIKVNKLNKIVQ